MGKQLKRFILFVALCCFIPAVPAAAETEPQPKLTLVDTVHKFGTVSQGTKVTHNFSIRNDGKGALIIRRIQPACGCTVSMAEQTSIEPGQSSTISAVFDTTGFHGEKVIPIRLYTNDPRQPVAELTLKGAVKEDVVVSPSQISFGVIQKGSAPTKAVDVIVEKGSSIQILDASTRASENIVVRADDVTSGGKRGKRVQVTLRDTLPVGVFRALVTVKTTSSSSSTVNIPVFARVQGDLRFEPTDVSFGLIDAPLVKPLTRDITLVNQGKQQIRIASVKSDSPAVTATVEQTTKPGDFVIHVKLKEGFKGTLKSRIQIVTNHPDPDQQQLVLPVYGIVAEKGA